MLDEYEIDKLKPRKNPYVEESKETIALESPHSNHVKQGSFFQVSDLKLGMKATPNQLRHIIDTYMILLYENENDEEGILVFFGDKQNEEYESWFMQEKPITPIYHTKMDLQTDVVYDG